MPDPIKVIVITQEEPFYIPKMVRHLLEQQGDAYQVVAATRLQPHRKNKTTMDWIKERTRIYTYWELSMTVFLFVYCKVVRKIVGKLTGYSPYSVASQYKKHQIPEINTLDLNDAEYVKQLKAHNADVILSISPPQIFQEDLLGAANMHCLNVHGTLLPRHRGVFGSWWTIYEEDQEAGGTIHTMELRLDAGEIVWQESFPVTAQDTQYSIARRTKTGMSQGMVQVLQQLHQGGLTPKPVQYEESYHRAPTRELGKKFHREGKRVITLRDLKGVLRSTFNFSQ